MVTLAATTPVNASRRADFDQKFMVTVLVLSGLSTLEERAGGQPAAIIVARMSPSG